MGVKSDDKDNPYEKRKLVNARIKELNIEINNHEQSIAPIRNKFTALSNKVKSYERYHFPNNPKRVAADLKKIKEKISFAAINVTEETELIKRKALLEDYQKDLNEFLKFKEENNETLNKTKPAKEEKKNKYKEREDLDKQIEELQKKKTIKKPEIERLNQIIDSLKKDKQAISKEIKDVYAEWDNQWYEYNEQQKLIKYIKDAKDKIKGLKKRKKNNEKNNEEGGEKTDKKDGTKTKTTFEDTIKINVYKTNEKDQKIEKYNHLKNYFVSLLPKQQDQTGNNNLDISKDVKAGKLKKIERKEDNDFVGQMPGKKKGKKPKEPKDSRKARKIPRFTFYFEIIQDINDAGLTQASKI